MRVTQEPTRQYNTTIVEDVDETYIENSEVFLNVTGTDSNIESS